MAAEEAVILGGCTGYRGEGTGDDDWDVPLGFHLEPRTARTDWGWEESGWEEGGWEERVVDPDDEGSLVKVDLHPRMLQAAFQLAKRHFKQAKVKKERRFPQFLKNLIYWWQGGETCFHDWIRVWELFHDWYPRSLALVRDNRKAWHACKLSVLLCLQDYKLQVSENDGDTDQWLASAENSARNAMRRFGNARSSTLVDRMENPAVSISLDDGEQYLTMMHAMVSEGDAIAETSNTFLVFGRPILRLVWMMMTIISLMIYEATVLQLLTKLFCVTMVLGLNFAVIVAPVLHARLMAASILFGVLPLLVAVYAIFGANMAKLAHDGMQYPPFKETRAGFIIATMRLNNLRNRELDRSWLKIIDFFFTWLLLIFMLVGMYLVVLIFEVVPEIHGDDGRYTDLLLNGLLSGALFWTAILIVLVACVPIRSLALGHEQCSRCAKVLKDALATYAIFPGNTCKYLPLLNHVLQTHKEEDHAWKTTKLPAWYQHARDEDFCKKLTLQDVNLTKPVRCHRRIRQMFWAVCLASTGMLIILITHCTMDYFSNVKFRPIVLIMLPVGMILSFIFVSQAARWTHNKLFRVHIILFMIIMGLLSVELKDFFDEFLPQQFQPMMTVVTNGTTGRGLFHNNRKNKSLVTPYPACNLWWGKPQAKVSLLDLGAMANYAYSDDKENFEKNLIKTFGDGRAKSIRYDSKNAVPRVVAARLCRSSVDKGQCTIIMAVRGTSSKIELMINMHFFSMTWQLLGRLAPVLGTFSVSGLFLILSRFRLGFLQDTHWADSFNKDTRHQVVQKLTEIKELLEKEWPGDDFVATGHSWGGTFAELLGAKHKIPAVGFSAPGMSHMMSTSGIPGESVLQNVVTIMSSLDPVPHIAEHLEMVQRIECRDERGVHRKPWSCHLLENTMCELWRTCGDVHQRDFTQTCLVSHPHRARRVNPDCIGKEFSACKLT